MVWFIPPEFIILRFPTFEEHYKKRKYERSVNSRKQYRKAIINTLAKGEIFYLMDRAGREKLIFFHPLTRWVVVVDLKCYEIKTAFKLYECFEPIENYLSRNINISDETSTQPFKEIVKRIRDSLKFLQP